MKTCSLLSVLAFCPALTFAAGPLTLEGSGGNTPVKYENPTVTLNFDIGTLGAKSNSQADTLVQNGFDLWNDVITTTINLEQGNNLPVDVDSSNYSGYMPTDTGDTGFTDDDGINPLIYDDDGSIIDAFFGVGQSDEIAGFATSAYFIGDSFYTEGYAVINGKDIGLDDTQLTLLVAHETGHLIGLDHSVNHIGADPTCATKNQSIYPLMYPFVCRHELSLHQDDIISVSTLYPSTDINTHYGQINGHFGQLSGAAILGTNIYARNTATNTVSSAISDYLKQGDGFFSIYLPPGTYTLHASSLDPVFSGASSVGPHAFELSDASFLAPHPITAVDFEGSTPGSAEFLIITAGEATEVEFKLDGSGTFTTGGEIFTAPLSPAIPVSGGGSGYITPATLLILLSTILLRRFWCRR